MENQQNNQPESTTPTPLSTPKKWYQHKGIAAIFVLAVLAAIVCWIYSSKYTSLNSPSAVGRFSLAGGGGSEQYPPDEAKTGEPAVIKFYVEVWGGGGPINGRYTDLALHYRLTGENDYKAVLPQPATLPANYTTNPNLQWEAYQFTIPPYPQGTTGQIEYYIDLKLDGHASHVDGIKKIPFALPNIQSTSTDLSNLKIYSNSIYGFQVQYPSGWTVKQNGETINFTNSSSQSFSVNILGPAIDLSTTNLPAGFVRIDNSLYHTDENGNTPAKQTVVNGNTIISASTLVRIYGDSGYLGTGDGDVALIVRTDRSAEIDFTAVTDNVFNKILSSFKFIPRVVTPLKPPTNTTSWNTYTNDRYGFEVKYPTFMQEFGGNKKPISIEPFICSSDDIVCFNYPNSQLSNNANFAGAGVAVSIQQATTTQACENFTDTWGTYDRAYSINGVEFYSTGLGEGYMQHMWVGAAFRAYHNSKCYEVRYDYVTTSCPDKETTDSNTHTAYCDGKPEVNQDTLSNDLMQVISTFKFLKK